MQVKIIHSMGGDGPYDCASGTCPTIYETDRGTFLLQGFTLSSEEKEKLSIPEKEDVVEVPKTFIEGFINKMK